MKRSGKNYGSKRTWEQIYKAMESKVIGPGGDKEKCKKMLRIIAARQLYVTYALKEAAERNKGNSNFHLCRKKAGRIIIPEYACYPENPGRKRCTSDWSD